MELFVSSILDVVVLSTDLARMLQRSCRALMTSSETALGLRLSCGPQPTLVLVLTIRP